MIHGPDLSELRERAKAAIMKHFVAMAEQDQVPPTLRAMYVRKAEQAQLVYSGGSSALIEGEAAARGWTPDQMAQVVLYMAASEGDQLEIARMRANVAVDSAANEEAVMMVLHNSEIELSINI